MEKGKFELLKEYLQEKKKLYRWAIEILKKVHKKRERREQKKTGQSSKKHER